MGTHRGAPMSALSGSAARPASGAIGVGERRPGRPRSAAAHRAILDAVLALLAEEGFGRLSIEGVAARAGVGKATVYRRWPSKVPLVIEALDTRASERLSVPDTGTVRGDLTEFLMQLVRAMVGPEGRVVAPLLEAMSRSPALADAFRRDLISPWRQIVNEIVRRGIARGELRADLHFDVALDAPVAIIFHRHLITGEPLDEALVGRLVDQVLDGIGAR
ncbi:MAG TPA: TetR/AcrR family transcriptional regulator [Acidimicrobiales bacterium]|nr:TetR/AcrR family transcriptional regulator [Acidimicrobiales bacterium]